MSYQPIMKYIKHFVIEQEKKPALNREEIIKWLECEYLFDFFRKTNSNWILIHLSTQDFFINSFTIDSFNLQKHQTKDSLDFNFSLQTTSINYGYGFSGEDKQYYFEKNTQNGLNTAKMHPLFFYRDFAGYEAGRSAYYEILQELVHFADLHWVKQKSAYCSLNDVGDVEEKIVIKDETDFAAIIIEQTTLERYLLYRKHFLCRFLELKRAMPDADWGGENMEVFKSTSDRNIWIRHQSNIPEDLNKSCNFIKSSQVILPSHTLDELETPKREYVSFIIHDWKNKKIDENSCDPTALDSYHEDTGKPYETSPVFFKPDVLLKYKGEPEKYELKQRSIYCRGAWSLQTYDVNEEGQVHTYICYLAYLPYREQLHWKQYNEQPKGNISQRAYKTDFKSEWTFEYDPLELLKQQLRTFPPLITSTEEIVIWKPKEELESLFRKIHYVTAGKMSEYKDFLMSLTILIIDGLQTRALQELVQLNPEFKKDTKSIGCLKLLLQDLKISEETINSIIKPLRSLQEKRSKYGGHGGSEPNFDLANDCRQTLGEIEVSLKTLIDTLKSASVRSNAEHQQS